MRKNISFGILALTASIFGPSQRVSTNCKVELGIFFREKETSTVEHARQCDTLLRLLLYHSHTGVRGA